MNSRALAKQAVSRLLERGYGVEQAEAEVCMGQSDPDGGFEIRHGKIRAPYHADESFEFSDIAEELKRDREQPSLL